MKRITKYRKKARGGKPWYQRKYNAMELAGKAWAGIKYLKGIINSERKFFNMNSTVYPDYTGATPVCLSLVGIAQGDTNVTRNGNSILVKSLHMRIEAISHASASSTRLKIMVFIDQRNNGTDPVPGNVLDDTQFSNVNAPLAPMQAVYRGRFKILYSRIIQFDYAKQASYNLNIFRKMTHHVRYDGTGAGDNQNGSIYVLFLSNEQTYTPTVMFNCRLSYYDN